jgi:hypothetical protein
MLSRFDSHTRESLKKAGRMWGVILEISWSFVERVAEAILEKEPSEEGLRVLTGNEAKAILGYGV